MENLKTNPSKKKLVNFLEHKKVASQAVTTQNSHEVEFFARKKNSLQIYSISEYPNNDDFDKWCSHLDSLEIDFQNEFSTSIEMLKCEIPEFSYWKNTLSEFMEAIKDYTEQKKEFTQTSCISKESAKRFLFLVPVFASHKPHIYIDASNGCFNVDMSTRDNGILSTQISENGQIHYSYVAQNKKIFKITGTAKFKDSRDFIKFNKVLLML